MTGTKPLVEEEEHVDLVLDDPVTTSSIGNAKSPSSEALRVGRRPSSAADAAAMSALHREAYAPFVDAGDAIVERAFAAGQHVVLVDIDGALVARGGIVAFMRVDRRKHELHLIDVVVAAAACGRNVGSTLVREVIDEALRASLPVSVHVPPRATRAIAFFKRLGFVVVPSRERGFARLVWSVW